MVDKIKLHGLTFNVSIERDDDMREPWIENAGHGVVSDWENRRRFVNHYLSYGKKPHERILARDDNGQSCRYYDVVASLAKAKKENWAPSRQERAELIDHDFKRLRDWCDDDWHWCGVVVTLLDVHGEFTHESEAVWGIESDSENHQAEIAQELAEEIADRIGNATQIPARPDHFILREIPV